ncbi:MULTISPECIES: acyl-CoA synthetase [unclassified Solwaraspora]|uniref:acyl-CoA synthetase n=1 Tax=unclassified Solwaraspora TaxID=2627926 RepID=UPI00259BAE97|nr:acyl-CoA synthetase [Solwaraspora sp. WMMA2056]WJK43832.1 acyl-CoA synthetase [Solwaraspora sp. WMMA2056]
MLLSNLGSVDVPAAVTVDGRALTSGELLEAAGAVARDVADASVVAIRATASPETVVAVTGCLLAGVPLVPVPPDAGPVERDHILRDCAADLLLDPGAGARSAVGVGPRSPGPRSGSDGGPPVVPVVLSRRADPPPGAVTPERTALILYTSGTTGAPKGVPATHAAIAAGLDALAEAWAWSPDDVLVHGLPLFHVHGLVLGVIGALRTGSRLVHTGRPTPQGYAAAGGSLYFAVPTVWSRVCADPTAARALRDARLLVSGSAALPVPVFAELTRLTGHQPVERYGMTETLITVSSRVADDRRPGWVGTPLTGVRTRLAGEAGELLPHDGESVGELQVRGPMVFGGYLGRAGRDDFTPDGWFRTGDVARIGPDGWHQIVGRASTDLIKSGGYRIGAGEVENVLLAHPAVREAAVVGAPDADLGQQVVAYVVADGVRPQQLIDFVATELSVHKRPRKVHIVDRLPRNAMGKVQKKALLDDSR